MGLIKKGSSKEDNVRKQQASEFLKYADRLLKEGNYAEALVEIEKTLEIDPKNFYARALKERVSSAQSKPEAPLHFDDDSKPEPKPTRETADKVEAKRAPEPIGRPGQTPPESPDVKQQKAKQAEELKRVLEQKRREEELALRTDEGKPDSQEAIRKKFLSDQRKAEAEAKNKSDEARKHSEEELRRRALELEILHKREESERKKAEEGREQAEEARRQLESNLMEQKAEAHKKLEEERHKAEKEREAIQAEHQRKLDEERRRMDEENRRMEEESRRRAEEAQRQLEAEKKRLEEEARQRAEQERLKREAEERERAKAEEERLRKEEAERKIAEEEARARIELELRKRMEQEQLEKQREEAIRAVTEEAVAQARLQKIQEYLAQAKQFAVQRNFNDALVELGRIYAINPEYSEARQLEQIIRKDQKELRKQELDEKKKVSRQRYLETYRLAITEAYRAGALSTVEKNLLADLRMTYHISDSEHHQIEPPARLEAYTEAVREAWSDGSLSKEDVERLDHLRGELKVSADQHQSIEQKIRTES